MKPTRVAMFAGLGTLVSSFGVYTLTPPGGGRVASAATAQVVVAESLPDRVSDPPSVGAATFTAGATLTVEGRVGHPRIAKGAGGETFMMLEVQEGAKGGGSTAAPVNLSIAIDRSGSMKGSRIRNAINAATSAVGRLHDGDVVSVVAFDTRVEVLVPPTPVGPSERENILSYIRAIGLGGDTCISCGLEEAMSLLDRTSGRVSRMVVLSDGDANRGVRDVPGFRGIARRAQSRGISITTIGVDVDYNEKIMAAIAEDSNGRHYFVQNDEDLARVFDAEAESLTATVATGTDVSVDLAPGVELERVVDRSFRRAGNRVTVPLGAFSPGDVKTVLLKIKVPTDVTGTVPVAQVELAYRDLALGQPGSCRGALALEVTSDASRASELDPVVSGRVQRSETASTLKTANTLFEQGRLAEAKRTLSAREEILRLAAFEANRVAPAAKSKKVSDDFDKQLAAIDGASAGFASPPAASPAKPSAVAAASPFASAPPAEATAHGKGAVRQNQERATRFSF